MESGVVDDVWGWVRTIGPVVVAAPVCYWVVKRVWELGGGDGRSKDMKGVVKGVDEIPHAELGNTLTPHDKFFWECYRNLGDVFFVNFLGEQYLVLTGYEGTEFFKNNEKNYFQVKGSSPETWNQLYGADNPILNSSEEIHRTFRKVITPKIMAIRSCDVFLPFLVDIVHHFLRHWESKGSFHSSSITHLSFAISWCWILGDRSEVFSDHLLHFYHLFEVFCEAMVYPEDTPQFQSGLECRKKIVEHFEYVYEHPPSEDIPNLFSIFSAYVDQMHPKGSKENFSTLCDLLIGASFAAYHAIAMALNGAIWELHSNPSLLAQIYDQIKETQDPDTLNAINSIKLLTKLTKEILRLYNAGSGIYRISNSPFTFKGYQVPANQKVFIFTGYDHFNVNDPWTFDPHRTEDYAWIPFGIGTRSCLGQIFAVMEIKVILYLLIKNYHITIPQADPKHFPQFEINGDITLRPRHS